MANIKSLADEIRRELNHPGGKTASASKPPAKKKTGHRAADSALLTALNNFDTTANKSLVHIRLDEKTVRLLNQFKMATGVDVSKIIAFSVKDFIERTPECKQLIKHFIQNTDL